MELVPVEYCASRFSVAVENRSIIAVLAPDLYQNDDPWGDSLLNCEQREEVFRLALERLFFEGNGATNYHVIRNGSSAVIKFPDGGGKPSAF